MITANRTTEIQRLAVLGNQPYASMSRWPEPLGHLEEFITSTGHDLTVDHSKGERIEEKYAELQEKLQAAKNSRLACSSNP